MKQREGDQPLPMVNDQMDCQSTFLRRMNRDIPPRRELGIERYGTALQPFNGQDAMQDAWEEFIDLGQYLEQLRREREVLIEMLISLVALRDTKPEKLDSRFNQILGLLRDMGAFKEEEDNA